MNRFDIGAIACSAAYFFVAISIHVGQSSGLSPWCDPLTFVPPCDHERNSWHYVLQVPRVFFPCHLVSTCLYFTLRV